MNRIEIKPLSVNEAWQGKRFKTKKYLSYEKELMYKLPKLEDLGPPYHIDIKIGVSALFDIDNCLKPFLDVLQKKYNINDRYIISLTIKKEIVRKGHEYIEFKI